MPKHRLGRAERGTHKQPCENDYLLAGEENLRPVSGQVHVLCVGICVVFAVWVWMLNPIPQIHPDQMNVVTMILSQEHPENFARDPIYGNRPAISYPPLWRGMIDDFVKNFGIIGGHRMAQFPLSVAYLFVMYGALYYLTRSAPAAVLVALASLIWRNSLGGTYWGLDRLQAVQPRSFVLIFVPILFILFWKLRSDWRLLIPFFVTGLLCNANPSSVFCFAVLSWFSLFLFSLYNRDGILRLIGVGAALVAGASPYIYINIVNRSGDAVELSAQSMQEYMNALQYRFGQMSFFPLPANTWATVLMAGFSVPVFLATIAWCLRKENRDIFDRWLVSFFLLAFVGTVIAQYSMQQIYAHFKVAPFLPNLLRGHKFAYLVLYIYIAWLLAELLRRLVLRDRGVLIIVTSVIVAVMPLFGNNPSDPLGQWKYNASQAKTLLAGEKIEIAGWHNYIVDICDWARQKTPKDSLFLFVNRSMSPFRIYALRSIVSSQGSGSIFLMRPEVLTAWARYQQELGLITARQDVPRLLKLADESGSDYIIVPNDFPKVTGWDLAMRDHFWTVYKKP